MVAAHSEEPAEAKDGVGHAPADLLDHDAFDRPDLLVVGAVDSGPLDLIAADQCACLSRFGDHTILLFSWDLKNAGNPQAAMRGGLLHKN